MQYLLSPQVSRGGGGWEGRVASWLVGEGRGRTSKAATPSGGLYHACSLAGWQVSPAVQQPISQPQPRLCTCIAPLQDLAAVELVPELIQAGVGCFKIEGAKRLFVQLTRPGLGIQHLGL